MTLFCKNKKDIYIFGNGIYGKECYKLLNSNNIYVAGFLVSGLHKTDSYYLGIPVYELETIFEKRKDWSQTGIIVCINSRDINSLGCDNVVDYKQF